LFTTERRQRRPRFVRLPDVRKPRHTPAKGAGSTAPSAQRGAPIAATSAPRPLQPATHAARSHVEV